MGGRLVDGSWVSKDHWESDTSGGFKRQESAFRDSVDRAEAGRFHLYVSHACPWAHRTLIVRALLGLEDAISWSTVHPLMLDDGWIFDPDDGVFPSEDPIHGERFLRDLYVRADPNFTGRVTVPMLWDKQTDTLVNNESAEIIRMLATDFAPLGTTGAVLYPEPLRARIDAAMDRFYNPINNGVYRCGFARTEAAYRAAHDELFVALDEWDAALEGQQYICGDALTIADVALFTTLIRFDPVYFVHFKTSKKHIYEYPHLWAFVRRMYALPGVAETVHFDHIRTHYFASHRQLNPRGFVPDGPDMDALLRA